MGGGSQLSLANNLQKINIFSFFWMFLVVMPVIAPLFLSLNLNMKQFFELQAIFGIAVAVLEVPTGYISDLWGRKQSILVGAFLSGVAFTLLHFAESYSDLFVYEIIQAASLSFVSGADIAILYDSVSRNDRSSASKALANMQFASLLGESIASVLGGILVLISFKSVTLVNALMGWVPFFVAITIEEPVQKKLAGRNHGENLKEVARQLFFNKDKLVILAFFNLVLWGLSSFIAVWIFQKYWSERGIGIAYFGGIWAALNLTSGIIGKQVHWLERRFGVTALFIVSCWAAICAYFGMSWFQGVSGVLVCFLFYVCRGITQVILREALNWRLPGEFRATVNSIQSLFFRLIFAAVGPVIGIGIDQIGIDRTLRILGFAFVLIFLFLAMPLIRVFKKLHISEVPTS